MTGATQGIGAALAGGLATAGAHVVVAGRREDRASDVAAAIRAKGRHATSLRLDVSQPEQISGTFKIISEKLGRLDILVNNAGVEEITPSENVTQTIWDRIIDTNLRGAFFCSQSAYGMMKSGGSILNVCSLTSEVGVPGAAPYGASKAGLLGLTRTLATEWAASNIRVNAIGPGYFRTALTESFYENAAWREEMIRKIPAGRFGDLDDLVGASIFLCSDAARYVTGQILYIDGGYMAAI